ncbi:tRNA (N(6)-L-threonylcarbamoyladenosine(37)-C(2))-methylthiotransferase MtaB [Sphingobium algorifonticola]|uniref:tRNA (N(6)-L-threonylcarbamoyladenosine(37)-C(2))-methylthiotransferase MtaB n=1 Tax=Sphingobium algorifonticola TaxID=2008318 RepID=A0A437JB30_9SPHN|nr:tRNA (N(6)-L-threonylcarbamoyladenosine(37)-C(2))-methylthiotransferase MtaB [Sphingobium algorifonticola]RVT43084.1 tRNA (N(6)-L-threonylcarbamoyladenosine(37)-C(2))-methylthiotransferase MtaB [Sphingobium algorifonticola]
MAANGPQLITMGCRLNIAESETMRALAAGQDDLVIVNSCAVTNEAVRQTRQAIRRARRDRPDARIVVTGCAAQTDPAMFAAMPEVDSVIGNREKMAAGSFRVAGAIPHPSSQRKLGSLSPELGPVSETPAFAGVTEEIFSKIRVSDIMAVRETAPHLVSAFADRVRGFVEVQNGCDHRCTFCIIPYGRGNSRSVPAGAVIDAVRALVDGGCREIVLTGVDVTSYGPDLPGQPTLGLLVERILNAVPALPRLRLSSLDSVEIDDRLFALVTEEPRLMPHLHLSLQAGDDMILKRMKRRHSRKDALDMVARIRARRPDVAIGADIIAGFPTETEAMFQNSLALVADCAIVHGHIFPYSPREGTPAARMPQVDPALVKDRAARLRDACAIQRDAWLRSMVGSRQAVLVERSGLAGHAENFAPITLGTPAPPGEILAVRVTALENGRLIAQEAVHD